MFFVKFYKDYIFSKISSAKKITDEYKQRGKYI